MIILYIGSIKGFSGKGMLTMVLAERFKAEGYKVGYMKPLGKCTSSSDGKPIDQDVAALKDVLNMKGAFDDICPVMLTQDLYIKAMRGEKLNLMDRVLTAFKKISKGKDIVLIEGADTLDDGTYLDLSPLRVIERMNAKVMVIDRYEDEVCVDCILSAKNILNEKMLAVLINHVPAKAVSHVREVIIPFLTKKGIEVAGIVPRDEFLGAVKVRELADALHARVLCGEESLDEYVERFSIGAMDVDSALKYFRKTPNKAVITGGHRSDIQIAALETSTKCLILTGDQNPSEVILGMAMAAKIPILVVSEDTLSTVDRVKDIVGKVHFQGGKKIERAKELIMNHFDYNLLKKRLKLK